MTPEKIADIIAHYTPAEARRAIDEALAADPRDDSAYYCLGRVLWKAGDRSGALSAYSKAVEINPDSPARHAVELARSVFDFFNPDLLNP